MGAPNTMFTWSLIDLVGVLFFFFSYRFLYGFIYKKDIPKLHAIIGIILILPALITTFLGLNLTSFDATYCEAIEEPAITNLAYIANALFLVAIIYLGIFSIKNATDSAQRRQIALATTGLSLFLLFFITSTYVVSFLTSYTSVENPYNYEIYGLFGMPVLLVFLGYLIVRFKAFNIKLVAAQALVAGLIVLIASEFLFVESAVNTILVGITFVLACIGGYFLVRSVKKEVAQREQIDTSRKASNVRMTGSRCSTA